MKHRDPTVHRVQVVAKLTGMTEHVSSLVARRECHETGTQTAAVTVVDCETLARANEGVGCGNARVYIHGYDFWARVMNVHWCDVLL